MCTLRSEGPRHFFPIPWKTKKSFHYISIKLPANATTRPLQSQISYIALCLALADKHDPERRTDKRHCPNCWTAE